MTVIIKDDGVGFDVRAVQEGYDKRGSLGMMSMQERTNVLNGFLEIRSQAGQGTEVVLTLPLAENLLKPGQDQ